MKLVTWNCNGALRNKFQSLAGYNADIIVIQECEDPSKTNNKEYQSWASNFIWKGDNKNKGLGIFCKDSINLTENKWETNGTKHFISANINKKFDLIAVWNHHANSPTFRYIGQLWKYLQIHKDNLNSAIIIGDFNSNKIWDKWDRWWNHSDVVRELEEIGIRSLYHEFYNEKQGEELSPTFFLQKNLIKKYHIDYAFASNKLIRNLKQFSIGEKENWLKLSDHLPIIIEY